MTVSAKSLDLPAGASSRVRPVLELGKEVGLRDDELESYGPWKAKVRITALPRLEELRPAGKVVIVTSINPTTHGEGKTTVTIGLAQGLQHIGRKAVIALREPSLGPVFGIKGGATGGGLSCVLPTEDINLHFTGDLHAVTTANNLLAALLDAHVHFGNGHGVDPTRVTWKRCLDMNDRSLRHAVIGLGGPADGPPRESGFDITAASEVMAILCLADGIADLKERLGRIILGYRHDGNAVFARDLNAEGAMAVLLKDAIHPNLVQSTEGVPALVHGGPFANIAHGTSSVLAARVGLRLGEFLVTEAGFGADLGFEKFMHIFSRASGLVPSCAVVVVTVRAIKHHGGAKEDASDPDVEAVRRGLANLDQHLDIVRAFGVSAVVAINRFAADHAEEIATIESHCEELGVPVAVSDGFARGGEGVAELAGLVAEATEQPRTVTYLYRPEDEPMDKVRQVARIVYGADGVHWDYAAEQSLARLDKLGLSGLPICVAKTQYSLSDQPRLLGKPRGWHLTIRDVLPSAGAGFLVALAGDIMRMPGLGRSPASQKMDLDQDCRPIGVR